MRSALRRYQVIAYLVGVLLVVLAFVAMPLKYLADRPTLVATVGPVHGFAYMVYLVLAFDLARRAGWGVRRTALLLLAGTIPVMSFVAERWATRLIGAAATTASASAGPSASAAPGEAHPAPATADIGDSTH